MVELFACKIKHGMELSDFDGILPFVSSRRRERVSRFRRREDALRTLAGEWMARKIIGEKTGLDLEKISFRENHWGKPRLEGEKNFHFNISHSGNFVVFACGSLPVGVDIEMIAPVDLGIARNYFSEEEHRDLFSLPVENQLDYFYRLWTLKESFIKAAGRGMSIPLDSFSIKISPGGETVPGKLQSPNSSARLGERSLTCALNWEIRVEMNVEKIGEGIEPASSWHFRQYDPDPGYRLAVCSLENDISGNLDILEP